MIKTKGIADDRIMRPLNQMLKAGVLQCSVLSPLLSSV